jgi:hypothetical protein
MPDQSMQELMELNRRLLEERDQLLANKPREVTGYSDGELRQLQDSTRHGNTESLARRIMHTAHIGTRDNLQGEGGL